MKDLKFEKDDALFLCSVLQKSMDSDDSLKDRKIALRLRNKIQNAMRTITVSSRKGKGRGLQYKVCESIASHSGIPYNQADDDCAIHSREMGQNGTDVVLRREARQAFPFSIECKAQESIDMTSWIRQAQANENEGMKWLLVFKKQTLGTEPFVCLDFETFMNIWFGKKS